MNLDLTVISCPMCGIRSPRVLDSTKVDYRPGDHLIRLYTLCCGGCLKSFHWQDVEDYENIVFKPEKLVLSKNPRNLTVIYLTVPIPTEFGLIKESLLKHLAQESYEYTVIVTDYFGDKHLQSMCDEYILLKNFNKNLQFSSVFNEKTIKSIGFNSVTTKFISTYPTVDTTFLAFPYWKTHETTMQWTDEDYDYLEDKWSCQHQQRQLFIGVPQNGQGKNRNVEQEVQQDPRKEETNARRQGRRVRRR